MARPSAASMLPGVLAAFAWITSLFAGVYCKFVSFTSTGGNTAEPVTLYFGIWYYQVRSLFLYALITFARRSADVLIGTLHCRAGPSSRTASRAP